MKKTQAMGWLLKSAVAAVPLLMVSATASAQYRIQNNDGRALDANSRLGSGGYNSGKDLPAPVSGNDIVTGNVTGLRYFHGQVDYTDPTAFRGHAPSGRNVDTINRTAGDVPTPDNAAAQFTPEGRVYLGDSRGVNPPPQYQQITPGSPGYVPNNQIQPRQVGDARMGDVSAGNVVDVPQPDQLILQGTTQNGQNSIITASPLTGIRPETPEDRSLLFDQNGQRAQLGLDDSTLMQMRQELGGTQANPNAEQQNTNPTNGNSNNSNAGSNGFNLGGPTQGNNGGTNGKQGASANQPLNSQLNSQMANNALNAAGAQTNEGVSRRFIIPPQEQSSTYAEMLRRYNQMEAQGKGTPEQQNAAYNAAMRAREQAAKAQPGQPGAQPGQPGQPGAQPGQPGAQPRPGGVAPAPGQPGQPPVTGDRGGVGATVVTPKANKPQPIQVKSLAEGMKGKGMTELMKQAEDLVREGKFNAALDKYDAAQQVVPNNPMVKMARAIAELGGSYYARAETHLREAYLQNPALMVAQYDLRNLLGEDRLQSLVKDLRDLATNDKKDPRPVFLLSFIAYNTGQAQAADAYLDLAQKRAGNRDAVYQSVRDHWTFPDKATEQQPAAPPQSAAPAAAPKAPAPKAVAPAQNK